VRKSLKWPKVEHGQSDQTGQFLGLILETLVLNLGPNGVISRVPGA